jgi:hypothetical protein
MNPHSFDVYIYAYWVRLKPTECWRPMSLIWSEILNEYYFVCNDGKYIKCSDVEFRDGAPDVVKNYLKRELIRDIIE